MFISLGLLWGPYHDDHLILHQVICSRGRFFRFLKVTTSEKKTGLLLIEVFEKQFNPQNYGHQGSILGGLSYLSGVLRISHFSQFLTLETMQDDK
jgi:hypothetical protein